MNVRLLVAAGAALMIAGGVAMAQPAATTPTTHAAASTPTATSTTTRTPTNPAPTSPATHATPVSATAPASGDGGAALSCRTSHDVGGRCACLKAPTRRGTVQAGANGGHNMCMVPARHA